MPLTSASLRASAGWTYTASNTGFNVSKQKDDLSGSLAADVATLNHAYIARHSLAAAGTATIDFFSLTPIIGTAVSITKFRGVLFVVTGTVTGGQLKIEPGAANPFALGMAGTGPSITIDVAASVDTVFMLLNGINFTISNTVKNLKISNPGSQSIVCDVFAILGT